MHCSADQNLCFENDLKFIFFKYLEYVLYILRTKKKESLNEELNKQTKKKRILNDNI